MMMVAAVRMTTKKKRSHLQVLHSKLSHRYHRPDQTKESKRKSFPRLNKNIFRRTKKTNEVSQSCIGIKIVI